MASVSPNLWKATDGTIGVDLLHTSNTAIHALGTRVIGNNNSTWVYCYASAAIAVYKAVSLRPSATATLLDATGARLSNTIGIAQVAFAAGDYGWVATSGKGLTVITTGANAVGARLYTSGTAGILSSTAASTQVQITDVRLIATASGTSASALAVQATMMVVVDPAFLI